MTNWVIKIYRRIKDNYTYLTNKKEAVVFDGITKERAIVLGNGPSVKKFMDENRLKIQSEAINVYVCNAFAKTPYYTEIKPKYYCLLDPLYFDLNDQRVINKAVDVIETWESIFQKTTWSMTIFTALNNNVQKIDELKKRFQYKGNRINWINVLPVVFNSDQKNWFYEKGIGLIGGMTVVHLSLQVAILNKHKKIHLVGVDHDWVENIRYDEVTKKVYLTNKHFFDEKRIYYGEGILANIDLEAEFRSFAESFKMFKMLVVFAEERQIQVVASSKSLLHFISYEAF